MSKAQQHFQVSLGPKGELLDQPCSLEDTIWIRALGGRGLPNIDGLEHTMWIGPLVGERLLRSRTAGSYH